MESTSQKINSNRDLQCNTWAQMASIREPFYNLVHWSRTPDPAISSFLEALIQKNPDPSILRESLLATQVAERLAEQLAPYAKGHEEGFKRLCEDVGELAISFAGLASSPRLQTTFALIENDMCRLFHTDAIELRLLCTYAGPGTLWVPDQHVNWDGMHERSNEARVHDLGQVRQFAPFEIGILKGAMYESNDGPAVLHRSPTISESGNTRVLLRFDSQITW